MIIFLMLIILIITNTNTLLTYPSVFPMYLITGLLYKKDEGKKNRFSTNLHSVEGS